MTAEWMSEAACRGMDPNVFHPTRGERLSVAYDVCDRCPVTEQCGDYALANGIEHGVWGGMSGRERRRERHGLPGTSGGRDERLVRLVCNMAARGWNRTEIAVEVGVTTRTVYRILADARTVDLTPAQIQARQVLLDADPGKKRAVS